MDQIIAKRLGKILRAERIRQRISTRALAEYCGRSHTCIIEIENGNSLPSEELCTKICEELVIEDNLYKQINHKEDIEHWLDIFFEYAYFGDEDSLDAYYQSLLAFKDEREFDLYKIDFELMNLIYYISGRKNNKSILHTIDIIEADIELLFPDEFILYNIYKAAYYININKLFDAETLLKNVEKQTDNRKYLSMIYSRLGILYTKSNKTALAIKYYIDAKTIFDKDLNYIRSLYSCSNIALAYMYSESYTEAIQACEECMTIAKRLNLNDVIMINAYNLSYLYILIGEYDKVSEYVTLSLKYGLPDNGIYFHNAYAYYKLNRFDLCQFWIDEGKEKLVSAEVPMNKLYNYLESQIAYDYVKSLTILKEILDSENYDENFDNQDYRFVLREFIDLCRNMKRYDLVAEYSGKLFVKV